MNEFFTKSRASVKMVALYAGNKGNIVWYSPKDQKLSNSLINGMLSRYEKWATMNARTEFLTRIQFYDNTNNILIKEIRYR